MFAAAFVLVDEMENRCWEEEGAVELDDEEMFLANGVLLFPVFLRISCWFW